MKYLIMLLALVTGATLQALLPAWTWLGGAQPPVLISRLSEAAARVCAELEDRVMECRMRGRADITKHLIQMCDLKFVQELTPLTTGNGPAALSPKQLLQVIDCIEGFVAVRRRALGSMSLSAQEKRPGAVLRETRRDMISRYMDVMGPKLHGVAGACGGCVCVRVEAVYVRYCYGLALPARTLPATLQSRVQLGHALHFTCRRAHGTALALPTAQPLQKKCWPAYSPSAASSCGAPSARASARTRPPTSSTSCPST